MIANRTRLLVSAFLLVALVAPTHVRPAPSDTCSSDWWPVKKLQEQAMRGDIARIDSSIKNGVYVDCVYDDMTALYAAAIRGQAKSVKRLLEYGANPNWQAPKWLDPPLHAAIHLGRNFGAIKALVKGGADVHLKDRNGDNALHLAARCDVSTETIEYLLGFEFDIHDRDISGTTPIIFSGASANPRIAEMLLDRGANPNDMDNYQRSALVYAADQGNLETAKVLVERGARVNTVGMEGNTALTMACRRSNYDIARLLLEHDADPFIKDGDGKSAYDAILEDRATVVRLLKESSGDSTYFRQIKARCEELLGLVEEYRKAHGGSQ